MSQNSEKDIRKTLNKHFALATDFVVSCTIEVYENNLNKLSRLDGLVDKENHMIIKGKCTTFNNENIVYLLAEKLNITVTLLCNQKTIYVNGQAKSHIPDSRPFVSQNYSSQTRVEDYSSKNNGTLDSMPISIEKFILRSARTRVTLGAGLISFFAVFFSVIFSTFKVYEDMRGWFMAIVLIVFFGVNIGCIARYNLIKNHPEKHKNYQALNSEYGIDVLNLELKKKLSFAGKNIAITANYLVLSSNIIFVIPLKNARYVGTRTSSTGKSRSYEVIVIYEDKTFASTVLFGSEDVCEIERVLAQQLGIITGDFKKHCLTYKMISLNGIQVNDDFMSVILAYHGKKRREMILKLTSCLANIILQPTEVDE